MLDNFRKTRLVWDKASQKITEFIRAGSNDNHGRKLSVLVTDEGEVVDLSGLSLSLYWETADKSVKGLDALAPVNATEGKFEIYYTPELLSNVGHLRAHLVLVSVDGRVISEAFRISVFSGIDEGAIVGQASFTALTDALGSVADFDNRLAVLDNTKANKSSVNQQIQSIDGAIDQLQSTKADRSNTMSQTEFDSWVATLLDGGPSIFMDSLAMLQSTYPTGASGVALVRETDPAKIYVWDGGVWKDFGEYQGLVPKDESITTLKLASKAITSEKLADNFNFGGFITTGSVHDLLTSSRVYLLNATVEGLPLSDAFFLEVNIYGTRFVQTMRPLSNQNKVFSRSGQIASSSSIPFVEQTPVLSNHQVENKHLANDISLNNDLPSGTDLNTVLRDGPHTGLANGGYLNTPSGFNTIRVFGLYVMPLVKGSESFAIQFFLDYTDSRNIWSRSIHKKANVFGEWAAHRVDESKDTSLRGSLTSGANLNTIKTYGKYLGIANSGYLNIPPTIANKSFMLYVDNYGATGAFRLQRITLLNEPTKIYQRYCQDSASGNIITEWEYIGPSSGGLAGKIVVNFGDSTIGNERGSTSVSNTMSTLTGAITYNVGFGGCRMAQHAPHWDAFSMYQIANSIKNNDWALQDAAILAGVNGMPGYFSIALGILKSINWSIVDYITIGYGTNDYTAGLPTDNANNLFDITSFGGALRYAIEVILEKYPNIKILVTTPMYRFWMNEDKTFKEDSDSVHYNSNSDTLVKFAKKAIEISNEYKIPSLDLYRTLGVNKLNRSVYFPENDGTHHNANGRKRIAEKYAGGLNVY